MTNSICRRIPLYFVRQDLCNRHFLNLWQNFHFKLFRRTYVCMLPYIIRKLYFWSISSRKRSNKIKYQVIRGQSSRIIFKRLLNFNIAINIIVRSKIFVQRNRKIRWRLFSRSESLQHNSDNINFRWHLDFIIFIYYITKSSDRMSERCVKNAS